MNIPSPYVVTIVSLDAKNLIQWYKIFFFFLARQIFHEFKEELMNQQLSYCESFYILVSFILFGIVTVREKITL